MIITKIIVEHFRSIERIEIDMDKFDIFVGQNNHGKTNFFEAVEWFYKSKSSSNDIRFRHDLTKEIPIKTYNQVSACLTEGDRYRTESFYSDP